MVFSKDWFYRLILLVALVAMAGGGAYAALSYNRQHTREQILAYQLSLTRHAADELESLFDHLSVGIDTIANDLKWNVASEESLKLLAANYPQGLLDGILQLDDEGNILAEYPPRWLSQSDLPSHLVTQISRERIGPRLITGTSVAALELIRDLQTGDKVSHLNVYISLKGLEQLLTRLAPAGSDIFVLDSYGKTLLHPDRRRIGLTLQAATAMETDPEIRNLLTTISYGEPQSLILHEEQQEFVGVETSAPMALAFVPLDPAGGQWRLAIATPATGLELFDRTAQIILALLIFALVGIGLTLLAPLRKLLQLTAGANNAKQLQQKVGLLQQQLEDAELRNQQLLDNAGDALFFVDPQSGAILKQNQACEALLGYTSEEVTTLSQSVLFPGNQRRKYLRLMQKVLKEGYGEEGGLQFRTKEGHLFVGAVHARLGSLGSHQVVHGVIRDVTRLKEIEQELRQRNQELTLLNQIVFKASESNVLGDVLATVREMVVDTFAADGGGIFLAHHNSTQLELVTHQGISAAILDELNALPPDQGLIGRALASGRPVSSANLQNDRRLWSETVRDSDWRALQSVPLVARGKTIGVLFIFHRDKHSYTREDIKLLQAIGQQVGITIAGANLLEELTWQNRLTQATNRELQSSRKLLKENLKRQQQATRTLERTELMKNNFLALASHELRTPLTYILSGSQLLLDGNCGELAQEQRRIIDAVHVGGKRLEEIVDNLLELARLEAQSIYLGMERFDIEQLLDELHQYLRPNLANNQLTLNIPELPPLKQMAGDRVHLFRTLQRLLENAIKFTPAGGKITLSGEVVPREQILKQRHRLENFSSSFFARALAPEYLRLNVTDTGIGIDPEEQLQIFDKFYEVGDIHSHFTSSTSFGGKGVGLGLALVRGMIEAHNGMVWVTSQGTATGGSTFHLLLPLLQQDAESPQAIVGE